MGERVAESFSYLVMIVAVLATITAGMTFVMLGDRTNDMFMNTVQDTYADFDFGMMSDIARTDYMEMTGAAALSVLYENQKVIYDVYDCRTKVVKEFDKNTGRVNKVTHISNYGGRAVESTVNTVYEDKFNQALVYLNQDLHKTIKVSVQQNRAYPDYFDVYLHDVECGSNRFHDGFCKESCKGGEQVHTAVPSGKNEVSCPGGIVRFPEID